MVPPPSQAAEKETKTELSEAEIAVHWKEEDYLYPNAKFIGQANLTDPGVTERFSLEHFPECFREWADLLTWDKYWTTTLDTSNAPYFKWFVGGKLNVCYNCVDRHLEKYGNKTAILFVGEPENEEPVALTYNELYARVNEFAVLLRDYAGLKTGDRVTIHMPMVAELPITMLACARLGIIHSVVFGGFSGEAAGRRAADSQSRVMIYMDAYYRSGKLVDHKAAADLACEMSEKEGQKIDKVLIWQRIKGKVSTEKPLVPGRDVLIHDVLKDYRGKLVPPVSMPAEAPLFLMYTSGTTGRPKGCQHSTGGYLAYVTGTSKWIQDIHPTDVYWCMADIGWITGHSYIVYGPLALAATSVIYEGVPTFPDAYRPWRIAERLGVNIFHTSPTAIRMLRKLGPDGAKNYRTNFKTMTTVGEPIEPVGLALVLRHGRQAKSLDHRYLVADRERRVPLHYEARARQDEARELRPRLSGNPPRDLRRERERAPGGLQQSREYLHPEPLARPHDYDLGRRGEVQTPVFREVQQESQQQGLAGLAVLRR